MMDHNDVGQTDFDDSRKAGNGEIGRSGGQSAGATIAIGKNRRVVSLSHSHRCLSLPVICLRLSLSVIF